MKGDYGTLSVCCRDESKPGLRSLAHMVSHTCLSILPPDGPTVLPGERHSPSSPDGLCAACTYPEALPPPAPGSHLQPPSLRGCCLTVHAPAHAQESLQADQGRLPVAESWVAWQGYLVDTAQLSFDITVTVQSSTSAVAETLHLGPTEPFSSTLDAQVNVQLLGDLSSYKSMPDFSSYYLMIPSPTGALTAWVLTNGSNGNTNEKHRLATKRAYQLS